MTKRSQWIMLCLLWAGVWFVLGVIVPVFWIFTLLSLSMILFPVGVPDTPSTPVANKHNPDEWSKHRGNEPRN